MSSEEQRQADGQRQPRSETNAPHPSGGSTDGPTLVTSHKRGKEALSSGRLRAVDEDPKTHVLIYHPGAQFVKVKEKPPAEGRPQCGGGRRGKVNPIFSKSQRRNMRSRLAQISVDEPAVFVDLTYPSNFERCPEKGFPIDPAVYTNDRKRFLDRLAYYYDVGVVWRLEFQEGRGAPHFHTEMHGLPDWPIAELQRELAAHWLDVIEVTTGETAPACKVHRPDGLDERRKRRSYLAKIDPRQVTSPHVDHKGRSWGIFRRKHVPFVEEETVELTEAEAQRVRRPMESYRDKTSRRKIGAHPHNPSVVLRRGLADEWGRWAKRIVGEREYLDVTSGEVVALEEIEEDDGSAGRDSSGDEAPEDDD